MPCDYSQYPDDWFTRIRPDILERDGHLCHFCGVSNYTPHPVTGSKVVLTIAHLDQDITNNAYSNLAALCQRCHNRHDLPHRIRHRAANKRRRLESAGQLNFLKGATPC